MISDDRLRQLDELVLRHQARLRAFLYSRTGSIDATDDLAQDIFLIAFRQIDRFDASRPEWPWLLGIARIHLHEHWRAAARENAADPVAALVAEEQSARDEDTEVRTVQIDALKRCVEKLPPEGRNLVRMLYEKGLSCSEAGKRIERAEGAVRMAIHRIRAALRNCIETTAGTP
jgi:RNA polymerase sigma-70 factor, ECF subfamily